MKQRFRRSFGCACGTE
jgi:hypothetical protein